MGDIYLEPMLSDLHFSRGYVSATFAFLESITLASGKTNEKQQKIRKKYLFLYCCILLLFSTNFNSSYK